MMGLDRVSAIAIAFGALLSVPGVVMIFDRDPPTRYRQVSVETPAVPAGGGLVIRYTLDWERDCSSTLDRTLIDGDGEIYRLDTSAPVERRPIGRQDYKRVVTVPASAASGAGRYRVVVSYVCNPVHLIWPIVVTAADVRFTILPPARAPPG